MAKVIVHEEDFDDTSGPGNYRAKVTDMIAWLQKHLDNVPEEHRANAMIDLDGGDICIFAKIFYEQ